MRIVPTVRMFALGRGKLDPTLTRGMTPRVAFVPSALTFERVFAFQHTVRREVDDRGGSAGMMTGAQVVSLSTSMTLGSEVKADDQFRFTSSFTPSTSFRGRSRRWQPLRAVPARCPSPASDRRGSTAPPSDLELLERLPRTSHRRRSGTRKAPFDNVNEVQSPS